MIKDAIGKLVRGEQLTSSESAEVVAWFERNQNPIPRGSDVSNQFASFGNMRDGNIILLNGTADDPTDPLATGIALGADGWTFGGTVYQLVLTKLGALSVGANINGNLQAGPVTLNENGVSAGGVLVIDANGFMVQGGQNIFMNTTNFNNILSLSGTGGYSALSVGANGLIRCIIKDGTDIYVGGDFTQIGGVAANHVAKWNGTAWSALGPGVNGSVTSLAMINGNLYIGGAFSYGNS